MEHIVAEWSAKLILLNSFCFSFWLSLAVVFCFFISLETLVRYMIFVIMDIGKRVKQTTKNGKQLTHIVRREKIKNILENYLEKANNIIYWRQTFICHLHILNHPKRHMASCITFVRPLIHPLSAYVAFFVHVFRFVFVFLFSHSISYFTISVSLFPPR